MVEQIYLDAIVALIKEKIVTIDGEYIIAGSMHELDDGKYVELRLEQDYHGFMDVFVEDIQGKKHYSGYLREMDAYDDMPFAHKDTTIELTDEILTAFKNCANMESL